MYLKTRNTLAVVGAGPKGIAVAVKAKVLHEMGLPSDKVVLIERHSVGAHWSGEAGFTDGNMQLGTSPEKDVVYPLETALGDPILDEKIRKRLMQFSWTSFLVEKGQYAEWIDRGRLAPKHSEWAIYLKWISDQLMPEVTFIKAHVESIEIGPDGQQWHLKLKGAQTVKAERLMLTGPGKTRLDFGQKILPEGTYDLESFWKSLKSGAFETQRKTAIVGAGENAASVLMVLSKLNPNAEIDVISPKGFVSTRAENFYENKFYSRPLENGWAELQLSDRKDFIGRTDIGVFSVQAMQVLNSETSHRIIPGRLIGINRNHQGLVLKISYGGEEKEKTYDQVILATGLDPAASINHIFTSEAQQKMKRMINAPLNNEELSTRIQHDLSVKDIRPYLHLPMLAGLKQGPGFANLSCLGLLSDRVILDPILTKNKLLNEVAEA